MALVDRIGIGGTVVRFDIAYLGGESLSVLAVVFATYGCYRIALVAFDRRTPDKPSKHICDGDPSVGMSITHDEAVLGGEPRIDGTRVGVRHVAARVIDSGQTAAHVADQVDVALADVYEALSYYYAHIEEMRAYERENKDAFERVRDASLKPKETVQ